MFQRRQSRWLTALGIGLLGGLVLSGVWPHAPLYAVATDRIDTYGMATGPVDNEVEAVYFLDFLTGDLKAWVLGVQPGTWSGYFERNVAADLGVDAQKNAKYLMTTGLARMRRAGGTRFQWSLSMCYVAEVTSGKVVAYSIPWSQTMYAANQPQSGKLQISGPVISFREGMATPAGRGGAMGPRRVRAE